MSMRLSSFFLVCGCLSIDLCGAQIYDFNGAELPDSKTLQTLYIYYVFSAEESPGRKGNATPYVEFRGLTPSPTTLTGIAVSIVRYEEFWDTDDPPNFCLDSAPSDQRVYTQLLDPGSPQTARQEIRETGIYVLVLSNCGESHDGVINGQVVVKNTYGYLPAIEYKKMPFCFGLFFVYLTLGLIWATLCIRWRHELLKIQKCISVVLFIGFVECVLWYSFLRDWNWEGRRSRPLFLLAVACTVAKSVFSYMLVLVASLGWGVTRPFLDKWTVRLIWLLSLLYIVLDSIRQYVLSFRHSHELPAALVAFCVLPMSLLNGLIFAWVFTALSSLMEMLEERRQTHTLLLFQRLWHILVVALTAAAISIGIDIFETVPAQSARWKYHWIFADVGAHCIFLSVLVCVMYLWAPNGSSLRYAYSDDCDIRESMWKNLGDGEDVTDDRDAFWDSECPATQGSFAMSPDVMGKDPRALAVTELGPMG